MKIEVYCLAHQEAKIMTYFMKHYTQFADVIVMEGHSTDRTVEIVESFGGRIVKVDSNNTIDDEKWTNLKNNCWKESKADWVIVCDADEFVYHPDLVGILGTTKTTVFMPRLFNMFTEKFPTTNGQIYDEVKYGREGGAKMNLFKPSEIKEINYSVGCHHAKPEGNVQLNVTSEIMTLHMRHLSRKYVIEKNAYLFPRLSETNKKYSWGYHLAATKDEIDKYFNNEMTALIKVV
jgi:glycosyltransferase involved in cell wall biosynthesis